MGSKKIVLSQYQNIVNRAVAQIGKLNLPREGWLRTVRKALGMSVSQLAERLNVTRAQVSKTELVENNGNVTLNTMHKMAEAMGCKFVYAIVPPDKIENLILEQAKLKAKYYVSKTNVHMALEDQLLSGDKIQYEIQRLTDEFYRNISSNLWKEDKKE